MKSSEATAIQPLVRTRKPFTNLPVGSLLSSAKSASMPFCAQSEVKTRNSHRSTHRSETMHTHCLTLSMRFAKIKPTPWSAGVFSSCLKEKWQDHMKKTIELDGLKLPLPASRNIRSFNENRWILKRLRISRKHMIICTRGIASLVSVHRLR